MFSDLITESRLRAAAGERAYTRGVGYFESGAVVDLVAGGEILSARVVGTDEYAVRLWNAAGQLGHDCSCPVGDEGEFCKHAVAAGLAWLARQAETPAGDDGQDDLAEIRQWLEAAPRQQLEALLLDQALDDAALRSRLDARAARSRSRDRIDIKSLKETVGKALSVRGFVDYHGMRRLVQRAVTAVDLIAGILEDGHAEAGLELSAYALKRGLAAYERTDDSSGSFGDVLQQLAGLHLQACKAAAPGTATFAKKLFDLMLRDHWGLLAFEDYAPLLGEAGMKAFRARAEKAWQEVPAREPGDDDTRSYVENFQITRIMESLARHAGDVDALISVKSKTLNLPYHFLEIAEVLAEAKRRDEALDWAERGHAAFPERPDVRLTDFLIEEYARRRRIEDAIATAWALLTRQPSLDAYQRLHRIAKKARAWKEWRGKARSWIRNEYIPARARDRSSWAWQRGGHSLLVEILLWEGDGDAALDEAKTGDCTAGLWFEIAKAIAKDRPAEAAKIYRDRLDDIVNQKNNDAYHEAARLANEIRKLMRKARQTKEFNTWLGELRTRHKAKRNFMRSLDQVLSPR